MPDHYSLLVIVNQADGNEHELDLGEITWEELPGILSRLYGMGVSSLVVTLVKA